MDKEKFVRLGVITEIVLLAIAMGIDALWKLPLEENPLRSATGLATLPALLVGTAAGVILSGWFLFSWGSEFQPLKKIQEFIDEQIAPVLIQCKHWELVVLAAFAGIGEEVLFRGVIQPRVGWVIASLLFGVVHPITLAYFVIAAVLGALLGLLQMYSGNLWAPILAHAVYDYIGFCIVIRDYRQSHHSAEPPVANEP